MTPASNVRPLLEWRLVLAIVAGAASLFILCLAARLFLEFGSPWRCPVMTLFHVPCPSCGSTRAFAALADGQYAAALKFNPLVVLSIIATPLAFVFRTTLTQRARLAWPLFFTAVFLNWLDLFFFLPR